MTQLHGGDIYDLARRLAWKPGQIRDFSASINPLGISPRAVRAMQGLLKDLDHYPDPGTAGLVDCLAEFHSLGPQCFLTGNGSTELIYLLTRVLRPKTVVIPSPAFGEYERACRLVGANLRFVGGGRPGSPQMNLDAILRACSSGPELVFICNPNNPTGQLLSKDQVRWLAKKLSPSTCIALDEAFIDYRPEHSVLPSAVSRGPFRGRVPDNMVVLRSFTKFFALAGLRAGYLAGPSRLVAKLREGKEPWTVNTLAQSAAMHSRLDHEYIHKSLSFMDTERSRVFAKLSSLRGLTVYPSEANFFLLRVSNDIEVEDDLCSVLADEGILVRNCESFRGLGRNFIRVAVRSREDNDVLWSALRNIFGDGRASERITAGFEGKGKNRLSRR